MQENYLAKWLNNELTEAELEAFKKTEEYASYQRILEASTQMEAPEFSAEAALDDFKQKHLVKNAPKVVTLRPIQYLMRIAAAVIVLVGAVYFYNVSQYETVSTSLAQRNEISLPDNSEVVLNADSKVRYNRKKWDQKRAISLEGEAFFKVAKGKCFTVNTAQGMVAVLGTQFNVENRDDFFEVTCYEGKVRVETMDESFILVPGQTIRRINGFPADQWESKAEAPSWVTGESTFKSVPIKYVISTLESQYDIKINAEAIDDTKIFTGNFTHGDLDVALQTVFKSLNLKYIEKEKGNIYLSAR